MKATVYCNILWGINHNLCILLLVITIECTNAIKIKCWDRSLCYKMTSITMAVACFILELYICTPPYLLDTVMKSAIFGLGFQAFEMQLQPWQANIQEISIGSFQKYKMHSCIFTGFKVTACRSWCIHRWDQNFNLGSKIAMARTALG